MISSLPKESLIDFFTECDDLIKACEQRVEEIEKGCNTTNVLQSLYRSIHTLKGSAQLAGYFELASLAHSIETALGSANSSFTQVNPSLQKYLHKSIQNIKQLALSLNEKSISKMFNDPQKASFTNFLSEFHIVVQELATMLGKKIDFKIVGDDYEIDYHLIRSLKAPLVQIIKNSCDHGIECPIERIQRSKSAQGNITILTLIDESQITIEICDDGKGLSHKEIENVITTKKMNKALIDRPRDEKEIYQIIFEPGFTTASSVSIISGRGIGMDVVNTEIKKLGGKVKIESVQNMGFKTVIVIPLKYQ